SLEHLGERFDNPRAAVICEALETATTQVLLQRKSPLRKVHQLDNRGSHFYLALFWAQALTEQTADAELAARFAPVAEALAGAEEKILEELNAAQGQPVDLGGYYRTDAAKVAAAMRPSATFNGILESLA
ncbi:MAG: NADP-dependent isocitrate dehydrogenase, partial [Acidobacteriota bacterium]